MASSALPVVRLYVGNLPKQVKTPQLRATFSRFGKVINANVVTFPGTKTSRGFGFVQFSSPDDAKKAMLATHVLEGNKLEISTVGSTQRREEARVAVNGHGFNGFLGMIDPVTQTTRPRAAPADEDDQSD